MNTAAAQFPYPWQRCKIIHLVRHGQATHNVEGDKDRKALLSDHLFDAQLSPLGLQQVCKLRKDVHASGLLKKIDLVITSPLYRTMQTAMGVFGSESPADGGNNDNFLQPRGQRPCDMRRRVSECRALFPSMTLQWQMDGEEDSMWNPDVRESEEEMAARMVLFMEWLWTRPEQEIVIVSHGIILQHILYVLGNDCHPTVRSALCKRFDNCELRPVVIVDKSLREADSPLCSPREVANLNVSRGEVSN
ncbi:Phosphoglycerate mutase family protein, putative isoform 1 [Hibiscus syriacus]|uniref:Phosphoglycerate mutase family protein, putative isoform 1 n=1 Tax=Hibiscus syriacus TaxID=106335 RepID=A0A6A2XEX3_HIBSY|nr:Phosphoglycerate mutase family protein, putative isoform 1 [Hibiscus syriacus]